MNHVHHQLTQCNVNAPTTQQSKAAHLCAGVSIPVVHQVESGQVKQLGKGHDQGLVRMNESEKVRKELGMQQVENGQVKQLGKGHDQGLVRTNESEKVGKELSMQQAVGQYWGAFLRSSGVTIRPPDSLNWHNSTRMQQLFHGRAMDVNDL